jgi:hypothetical protein
MSARAGSRPWEVFVRETLSRLSADLRAGIITVRIDNGGQRYVVDAPGNSGRGIVVPCNSDALMVPPQLPLRDIRNVFSPFTIRDPKYTSLVQVPWFAIRRNYYVIMKSLGNDRKWRTPPPESIVVLRLRHENDSEIFGWYVRFCTATNELVRVPPNVCKELIDFMESDVNLWASSLVSKFSDVCLEHFALGKDFNSLAHHRFSSYKDRVTRANISTTRKRKCVECDHVPNTSSKSGETDTCVICLEEDVSAKKRCRKSSCGAFVCATCHSHSRGLCPVCDRTAINADYPCSHCNRLFRLPQYGYPCVCCLTNCLCRECYKSFGECSACETHPSTDLQEVVQ